MAVDAQLQTMLQDNDGTEDEIIERFLTKFDSDWQRYNRNVIRKVQDYEASQG